MHCPCLHEIRLKLPKLILSWPAASCKHGNESSGFITGGEFLDSLSDYQLIKSNVLNQLHSVCSYFQTN
jgi:hypothetical protein